MNNFTKRALTALVFVVVLISCIAYNHYTFSLLFLFFTLVGTWEFYSISVLGENLPQKLYGLFLAFVIFALCTLKSMELISYLHFTLLIPLLYLVFVVELYRKNRNPFRNIAFTFLGLIYVALPFSLLNFVSTMTIMGTYEPRILIGILLILWGSDTGAYLAGSKFGKTKLFERISPKKSWEGFVGGVLLSATAAIVDSKLFSVLELKHWLVISVIIVAMGTLGDLVESLYKRSKNIKDSGTILPGHGGILDRFDSLLLASPFIFAYLLWVNN